MLARCCRGKVSVWAGVCVLVLCWFYVFPGYRLPGDKEVVDEVLRQGGAWQKNQTGIDLYRLVFTDWDGGGGGVTPVRVRFSSVHLVLLQSYLSLRDLGAAGHGNLISDQWMSQT